MSTSVDQMSFLERVGYAAAVHAHDYDPRFYTADMTPALDLYRSVDANRSELNVRGSDMSYSFAYRSEWSVDQMAVWTLGNFLVIGFRGTDFDPMRFLNMVPTDYEFRLVDAAVKLGLLKQFGDRGSVVDTPRAVVPATSYEVVAGGTLLPVGTRLTWTRDMSVLSNLLAYIPQASSRSKCRCDVLACDADQDPTRQNILAAASATYCALAPLGSTRTQATSSDGAFVGQLAGGGGKAYAYSDCTADNTILAKVRSRFGVPDDLKHVMARQQVAAVVQKFAQERPNDATIVLSGSSLGGSLAFTAFAHLIMARLAPQGSVHFVGFNSAALSNYNSMVGALDATWPAWRTQAVHNRMKFDAVSWLYGRAVPVVTWTRPLLKDDREVLTSLRSDAMTHGLFVFDACPAAVDSQANFKSGLSLSFAREPSL